MATSKAKKAEVMAGVRKLLETNQNVVLAEYRGLNVEQVTALRAQLRKTGVKLRVIKNTLSKKMFHEAGIKNLDEFLHGPVAVSFLSSDIAASSKAILEFAKKNELFAVKAAFIEGKAMDVAGLKAIASLPPREVLLAMLLYGMKAPVQNVVSVLQGTARKLVYALNAIKEQKQKQAV